jgi:peptide deformylase
MILPIKRWPESILLLPCQQWDFSNPPVSNIEPDLIDTMMSQQALGLAANQVGIPYRVMAMNVQSGVYAGQQLVLVNPEINKLSEDLWEHREGCLSFPRVELDISRPKYVYARWRDIEGAEHSTVFSELDAKCFLHEIDHLNGRVFKEYVSDLKYQRALKKSRR